MCCPGYDANISYCPNCGSNSWNEGRINWNYPTEFKCNCGWKGIKNNLLTKKQLLKKQRKIKIKSLLN